MRHSDLGRQLRLAVVRGGPDRHPLPEPRACAPSRVVLDEVSPLPAGVWHWRWTEGPEKVGIGPSFAPKLPAELSEIAKRSHFGFCCLEFDLFSKSEKCLVPHLWVQNGLFLQAAPSFLLNS